METSWRRQPWNFEGLGGSRSLMRPEISWIEPHGRLLREPPEGNKDQHRTGTKNTEGPGTRTQGVLQEAGSMLRTQLQTPLRPWVLV